MIIAAHVIMSRVPPSVIEGVSKQESMAIALFFVSPDLESEKYYDERAISMIRHDPKMSVNDILRMYERVLLSMGFVPAGMHDGERVYYLKT